MKKILFIGNDLFSEAKQLYGMKDWDGSRNRYGTSPDKKKEIESAMEEGGAFLVELGEDASIAKIYDAVVARTYEEAIEAINEGAYDHYVVDLNFTCQTEESIEELLALTSIAKVDLGLMPEVGLGEPFGVLIAKKLLELGLFEKTTIFTLDIRHSSIAIDLLIAAKLITSEEIESISSTDAQLASRREIVWSTNHKIVIGPKHYPTSWFNLVEAINKK